MSGSVSISLITKLFSFCTSQMFIEKSYTLHICVVFYCFYDTEDSEFPQNKGLIMMGMGFRKHDHLVQQEGKKGSATRDMKLQKGLRDITNSNKVVELIWKSNCLDCSLFLFSSDILCSCKTKDKRQLLERKIVGTWMIWQQPAHCCSVSARRMMVADSFLTWCSEIALTGLQRALQNAHFVIEFALCHFPHFWSNVSEYFHREFPMLSKIMSRNLPIE